MAKPRSSYDLIKVVGSVSVRIGSTTTNQLFIPRATLDTLNEKDLKKLLLDYMLTTKHIEVQIFIDERLI